MYAKVIIITWSEFLSFDWQAAWAIFFSSYHIFSLVVRRALIYLIDKTGLFFHSMMSIWDNKCLAKAPSTQQ